MKSRQRFRLSRMLSAVALAAGLAVPAAAQDVELVTGSSLDLIVASFERNGFRVELLEDSNGNPQIKSTDKTEPFTVYFFSCTDGTDCGFIQLTTGWNLENGITLARIEEWNAGKVWGKAFRDNDNDPWLDIAVNLKGGVTIENFDDTVDWWRVVLRQFEEHIGWK